MSYVPPKLTDKDGRVYYGDIAWEKMWEKFLEFGRTTIPERPFANLPIKITDNHYPPSEGYRELLKKKEREILKNAIPDLSDAMLEAVLRRVYNMGDEKIKSLTWRQIFDFCKDYVKSQHNGSELTETGLSNKQDNGGKTDLPDKKLGIFKRIPYWIYILTIFFAALLTCLYYILGWLEPIKAFILQHK
jgi:hypothetical protein